MSDVEKVLRNRVAFVREVEGDETEGGLAIPDIAVRASQWGQVHFVGSEVDDIEVGDRVLVDLYQGVELNYGRRIYWVVDDERVLATG